jgi:hypothetical protein
LSCHMQSDAQFSNAGSSMRNVSVRTEFLVAEQEILGFAKEC